MNWLIAAVLLVAVVGGAQSILRVGTRRNRRGACARCGIDLESGLG